MASQEINSHKIIRHCNGAMFQRTMEDCFPVFTCVNEGGGRTVALESGS